MNAPARTARGVQRGVALVTALLVVALATVAAVAMATRLHVDLRRTANLLHGEQAYAYAVAAENWALVVLRRDRRESAYDAADEEWATALPPLPVEGGYVNGLIADLQGRFNLNNLVDARGEKVENQINYYMRLLEVLNLDPALATALVDWLDPDINASFPGGAEDDTYLLADPPYRAANRALVSISELALVQGYTPEVIAALQDHVTALPGAVGINVNTATAPVLRALSADLGEQDVVILLEDRARAPFEKIEDFRQHSAMAAITPDVDVMVASDWFLVLTDVAVGSGTARLESVVHRTDQLIEVISRVRSAVRLTPLVAG